jgi:hypothetical protein
MAAVPGVHWIYHMLALTDSVYGRANIFDVIGGGYSFLFLNASEACSRQSG